MTCIKFFAKSMKNFTLIEMLVVIAIIGILASLLAPSLSSAIDSGRTLKCQSNLKNLGTAGTMYAEGNNNHWPVLYNGTWEESFINNAEFITLYLGEMHVSTSTTPSGYIYSSVEYSMPPEYLCPQNEYNLVNGLAYAFKGYPMSYQGFVDASIPQFGPNYSYRLNQIKQSSGKIIHLDGKNWLISHYGANPFNVSGTSSGVNYKHGRESSANALFFDTHVERMYLDDLYVTPRQKNDCWDAYGKY